MYQHLDITATFQESYDLVRAQGAGFNHNKDNSEAYDTGSSIVHSFLITHVRLQFFPYDLQ